MAERTKIWIAQTMKKLLVKKSIDQIRVTEICKEAQIERPTFYYHFQDKYDLMAWMFCQNALHTDVLSLSSAAAAMKQMRQDFIFYKRAYEDHFQNPMWSYILEYFVTQYTDLAKEILHTEVLDMQVQFAIRMYCYGSVGMTREWLLKDNITSAETIVSMMFGSMPSELSNLYFKKRSTQ